jgi:hypothetical protein
MTVVPVRLDSNLQIRAYTRNALWGVITDEDYNYITTSERVGAIMVNNSRSWVMAILWQLVARVAPGFDNSSDFGHIDKDSFPPFPAAIMGGIDGRYTAMLAGGCIGIQCGPEKTTERGNTDGIPSTAPGDPVPENEDENDGSVIFMIFVISFVLLLFGAAALCLVITHVIRRKTESYSVSVEHDVPPSLEDIPQTFAPIDNYAVSTGVKDPESDQIASMPFPYPPPVPLEPAEALPLPKQINKL